MIIFAVIMHLLFFSQVRQRRQNSSTNFQLLLYLVGINNILFEDLRNKGGFFTTCGIYTITFF